MGRFSVDDEGLQPLFEAIDALAVPVMIDGGPTGMGAGLPGGRGSKIPHAHPLAIDELASKFPNLTIIAAHPGRPWVEETTAVALHKGNAYWELSGCEIFPGAPEAGYSREAPRQNHVRQRPSRHGV